MSTRSKQNKQLADMGWRQSEGEYEPTTCDICGASISGERLWWRLDPFSLERDDSPPVRCRPCLMKRVFKLGEK